METWMYLLAAVAFGYWGAILLIRARKKFVPETVPALPAPKGSGLRRVRERAAGFINMRATLLSRHGQSVPPQQPAWFRNLVAEFKRGTVAHIMIVGATGSGKTTMALHLLAEATRFGKVAILDPHASPHWRFPAYGGGRNFAEIETVMRGLLEEMDSRFKRYHAGHTDFEMITVFMDETPAIKAELTDTYKAFMPRIAREARKVNMRLVILSQSERVESLGISGEGDIRDSFTFIMLGAKARELLPKETFAAYGTDFPAAIGFQGLAFPVDRRRMVPNVYTDVSKAWKPPIKETDTVTEIQPEELGDQEEFIKAALILGKRPDITAYAMAKLLYPDSNGKGRYWLRADAIMKRVLSVTGSLPADVSRVTPVSNGTLLSVGNTRKPGNL